MKVTGSSSKEMASFNEAVEIVKTLIPIECTVEEWFDYLDEHTSVWKVCDGSEVVGFYTLSPDGFFGEGHAYIFPSHRRLSTRFLRMMIEHVNSMGLFPKTTATSDFPHVVKFLKMLGFTEVGVEIGGMTKPKGKVDVYHFLYLTK